MAVSISIDVNTESFDRMAKKFPVKTKRELRVAMEKSVAVLQRSIVKEAPKDTGGLANSFTRRVTGDTLASILGEVSSPHKAADVMEFGRRKGARMPPVAAIEFWAARHGMPGMGYVIARSIAKKGIKGRKYIDKAFKENDGRITGFFNHAVDMVIRSI